MAVDYDDDLYTLDAVHSACMQAVRELTKQAVSPKLEAAFKDYTKGLMTSPRAMRRAELNLDRIISSSLGELDGWDKANQLRDGYKQALDTSLVKAIDQLRALCLRQAESLLEQEVNEPIKIPETMSMALRDVARAKLLPGKYDLKAAEKNLIDVKAKSEEHFTLAKDDPQESPARSRANHTALYYIRHAEALTRGARAAAR